MLTVRPEVAAGIAGRRDCWRSRHAFRPARSWRTAHTMTRTASTTMATTKIPKIAKKATFVAGASGTRDGAMQLPGYVTPRGHTAPMVLVAPRPLLRPAPLGVAPADRGSGREVLALLRGDTAARPRFDPELAGGLRAWLEDAAYDVVATRGEHAPPLFLGPSQLLGSPAGWRDDEGLSDELILSRLVPRFVPPARPRGGARRPAPRRARRAACLRGRGPRAATSSRCLLRRGRPSPRRWRRTRRT